MGLMDYFRKQKTSDYEQGYAEQRILDVGNAVNTPVGRIEWSPAIETACQIYRRAFAMAEATGLPEGLDLPEASESLVRHGHYVALVMMVGSDWVVEPVWPRDIRLKDKRWQYKVSGRREWVMDTELLHVRTSSRFALDGPHGDRRIESDLWDSHWRRSNVLVTAYLNALEFVRDEMNIPPARFMPLSTMTQKDPQQADQNRPKNQMAKFGDGIRGKLTALQNIATASRPGRSLEAELVGPAPNEAARMLYRDLEEQILSVVGVPAGLAGRVEESGTDLVESTRIFETFTLRPMARMIATEIARVTGSMPTIRFPQAHASDVRASAMAIKALHETGILNRDELRKLFRLEVPE